jgi:hypothetical protein
VLGGDEVWAGGRREDASPECPAQTTAREMVGSLAENRIKQVGSTLLSLVFGWFVSGRCQIISQCQDPAAAAAQEEEHLCKHKIL